VLKNSYDPGLQGDNDRFLCLHRNENRFVEQRWYDETLGRAVKSQSLASYPDSRCLELREALSVRYGVPPESVYVGNGSDGVLGDLFCRWRRRYRRVAVRPVGYLVYRLLANRYGYGIDEIDERAESEATGWTVDGPRLVAVDSPDAITGRRLPEEVQRRLRADDQSFLIWDNAYGDFDHEPLGEIAPNMASVRSFSKFYGLSALRVGYCLADAELVAELDASKDVFNVNGIAQSMALEALRDHDRFEVWADEMRTCRAALHDGLTGIGFSCPRPIGNFVFASHHSHSAADFQQRLRTEHHVLVRHFAGTPASDGIRITVPKLTDVDRLLSGVESVVIRSAS